MMKWFASLFKWYDSLPDAIKPAVLTASCTLLGAFLGACAAQYFSHRLTLKREDSKFYKEIYFNLFSPIIHEVYAFLDISTHYRRGHDINPDIKEEEILQKIIDHISKNLRYTSPSLRMAYETVLSKRYSFDGSGFGVLLSELDLIFIFLKEYEHNNRKAKTLDPVSKDILLQHQFFYYLWKTLIRKTGDPNKAIHVLRLKFYFDTELVSYNRCKAIMDIIEKDFRISEMWNGKMTYEEVVELLINYLISSTEKKQGFKEWCLDKIA